MNEKREHRIDRPADNLLSPIKSLIVCSILASASIEALQDVQGTHTHALIQTRSPSIESISCEAIPSIPREAMPRGDIDRYLPPIKAMHHSDQGLSNTSKSPLSAHPIEQLRSRSLAKILKEKKIKLTRLWLEIDTCTQTLFLRSGIKRLKSYPISTAQKGLGMVEGSEQTPLGLHKIHKKIGKNAPLYRVFTQRKATRHICRPGMQRAGDDYITTRILQLEGLEPGINQGKNSHGVSIDSLKRYIYIHGTPEESTIGSPVSHGCIRMKNADILVLFDLIEAGSLVWIH